MSFLTGMFSDSFGLTIASSMLSKEIADALKAETHVTAPEGTEAERFKKTCEKTTNQFIQQHLEGQPLNNELLDSVVIPANLAYRYLGEIIPTHFFDRLEGEGISMKEIRMQFVSEDVEISSFEDILSEAHAINIKTAEEEIAAAQLKAKIEQESKKLWFPPEETVVYIPKTFIAELLEEPQGPTYVAALLSAELERALKTSVHQIDEVPGKVFMETCESVLRSFGETNFGDAKEKMHSFTDLVTIPSGVARQYFGHVIPEEVFQTENLSLSVIAQYPLDTPRDTPRSFESQDPEIDAVLPSLDSHLAEAHMRAEDERIAYMEDKVIKARLDAEQFEKETKAASQSSWFAWPLTTAAQVAT